MNNELMSYANGDLPVPRHDREAARRAKRIYDEVRTKDLMARGALALAADIVDHAAALHRKVKQVAGDDIELEATLSVLKANAFRQAMDIQNTLYDPWGF